MLVILERMGSNWGTGPRERYLSGNPELCCLSSNKSRCFGLLGKMAVIALTTHLPSWDVIRHATGTPTYSNSPWFMLNSFQARHKARKEKERRVILFKNWNNKLITAILILLLLNVFVVKNDFMSIVVMAILAGAGIYWNRKELKRLSWGERIGIAGMFIVVIFALACFFLFIASPLMNLITIGWLRFMMILIIIIAGVSFGIIIIQQGIEKITKGKYSFDERVEKSTPNDMPVNVDIQQLVDEGKTVEAVKVARETYGYSLLEAKQYIDTLTNR